MGPGSARDLLCGPGQGPPCHWASEQWKLAQVPNACHLSIITLIFAIYLGTTDHVIYLIVSCNCIRLFFIEIYFKRQLYITNMSGKSISLVINRS